MPTYLQPNQVVAAVTADAVKRVLEPFLESQHGTNEAFKVSKCGLGATLSIDWSITSARVRLEPHRFVFDDLEIDSTFNFRFSINFNDLYDCIDNLIHGWLPDRCWEICVPGTDLCWSDCLDLGEAALNVPIPISFDFSGEYRPWAEIKVFDNEEYWHVFPELVAMTGTGIDVGRTIERICKAIGDELPWPLSWAAEKICELFGKLFDVLEDAITALANRIVDLFWNITGGWVGIKLRFLSLVKIPRNRFPGTGDDPNNLDNPAVPILIDAMTADVNDADELDVRFLLLSAP